MVKNKFTVGQKVVFYDRLGFKATPAIVVSVRDKVQRVNGFWPWYYRTQVVICQISDLDYKYASIHPEGKSLLVAVSAEYVLPLHEVDDDK